MKENKISLARVSKNICYFIAPIFGIILIACIAGLIIMDAEIELENTTNYYDTKIFSNTYLESIYGKIDIPEYLKEEIEESKLNSTSKENTTYESNTIYPYGYDIQENVEINGNTGIIYYNTDINSNFKYLMIDTKNNIAITNLEHTMRTDTIEEIKGIISENSTYWNFKNDAIDTNISYLTMEEIRYTNQYEEISNSSNRINVIHYRLR